VIAKDPTIHRQVVAAARMLLSHDPATPIAEIVERAGVSRATFYRHFGTRQALLEAVQVEPPAPARERITASAAELMARGGLHAFSMEDLALAAGVSRATVYRLFPSKGALFGELVRRYSPFEPVAKVLAEHVDQPPAVVVPLITRTFAEVGYPRLGIMRGILLEAAALTPEAVHGLRPFLTGALAALRAYFERQMAAGRVRQMDPLVAVQAVIGPIAFHLLSRPLAEQVVGVDAPVDAVVEQMTAVILGGLAPGAVT
jgi:AcrR family transcriptional regulator